MADGAVGEVDVTGAEVSAAGRAQVGIFRYRATDLATGRAVSGEQAGDSAYGVRAALRRVGLRVHAMEALDGRRRWPAWAQPVLDAWHARCLRRRQVARADLFDGLATLVRSGMPLDQAVASLAASETRGAGERRMLRQVRDRLRAGATVSDACAGSPGWFDGLDLAMLATGQQAGDLPNVLASLAQLHQRGSSIGQKLFAALAYPALLGLTALGAVVFLSLVPLPKLLALITNARHEPPWLTVHLVQVGQAIAHWWPLISIALVVTLIGLRALVRRIPRGGILGAIVHRNLIARARVRGQIATLAFTLARLRRSGLPLVESLEAAADTAASRSLRGVLHDAVAAIRRGEDLSAVVARSTLLEPEFAQLLQLGERSGELTALLEQIAERFERSCHRTVDQLTALLGPVALLILAALIGVVAFAAILPIVQLGDLI